MVKCARLGVVLLCLLMQRRLHKPFVLPCLWEAESLTYVIYMKMIENCKFLVLEIIFREIEAPQFVLMFVCTVPGSCLPEACQRPAPTPGS